MKFKRTRLGNWLAIHDGYAAVGSSRPEAAWHLVRVLWRVQHTGLHDWIIISSAVSVLSTIALINFM